MFLQARRRRARAAASGAAVIALLATACSGSGGGSGAQDETLVVFSGQAGDYQRNFNPFSPTMNEGQGTIFESLFYFNQVRDEPAKPLLGTEYAWNDDGTELSVTLRDDVTWSDGEKFTADDVVFTLDMVSRHKTLNNTGYKGRAEAVDDTHVRITFPEPAYMEGPQVLGEISVVPEHIWKDIENPAKDTVQNPVGTGPFTLEEFKPQAFTLRANPGYWDGEPELKQVRYVSLSGNQAGANALAAGKIDWQTGPVPDIKNVEKNYPGYQAVTVPLNQNVLITCADTELGCEGPQTDPAVRRAIYYGMDRAQLNSLAYQDTFSQISPGFASVESAEDLVSEKLREALAPMEPDTAEAARILEGAGYAKGSDGIYAKDGRKLSMTVHVVSGWTDYITAVDTLAEQMKAIGIELTARQSSWNEWSEARGRGEYQLLIDALYPGPTPDPFYLYSYFFSTETTARVGETANPNFARYSDEGVDKALRALKGIAPEETEQRQKHYDAIQTRIEADMPYIPILTAGVTSEYHDAKFEGWPTEYHLYAVPAVWSRPDQAQIFKALKPAG
ncbi:peptide ABC transporter substrate-binding protein [Streptomyces carminius]|uniref:Peptide ABC transporter substrate-binding protein n=1 Tax=Streptomyces carminius TaxID=2665496 RepID=A0A2M8LTI4_9ACTN|nr:ABC transporter substrate-binding protein [Streptomyces carminius]PJE95239.1 peptide ABC transporter substrate-binding protein [Streptomyces carminius]